MDVTCMYCGLDECQQSGDMRRTRGDMRWRAWQALLLVVHVLACC
jgi:hypothetical protein